MGINVAQVFDAACQGMPGVIKALILQGALRGGQGWGDDFCVLTA